MEKVSRASSCCNLGEKGKNRYDSKSEWSFRAFLTRSVRPFLIDSSQSNIVSSSSCDSGPVRKIHSWDPYEWRTLGATGVWIFWRIWFDSIHSFSFRYFYSSRGKSTSALNINCILTKRRNLHVRVHLRTGCLTSRRLLFFLPPIDWRSFSIINCFALPINYCNQKKDVLSILVGICREKLKNKGKHPQNKLSATAINIIEKSHRRDNKPLHYRQRIRANDESTTATTSTKEWAFRNRMDQSPENDVCFWSPTCSVIASDTIGILPAAAFFGVADQQQQGILCILFR